MFGRFRTGVISGIHGSGGGVEMSFVTSPGHVSEQHFRLPLAQECVLSWNAREPISIQVRAHAADGRQSDWLPYVELEPWRSCSSRGAFVAIEVDVLRSAVPLVGLDVRSSDVARFFLASPPDRSLSISSARPAPALPEALTLSVPALSQYVGRERGWCAPASLAMVMGYWADILRQPRLHQTVATVAGAIADPAYAGTGNWTFAAAYAARYDLQAAVVYLSTLDQALSFLHAGLPLILPIAWERGALPGAPLPESEGHLVVLRGTDSSAAVLVHDPALPDVQGRYDAQAFESVWQAAGGVALVLAPINEPAFMQLLLDDAGINV